MYIVFITVRYVGVGTPAAEPLERNTPTILYRNVGTIKCLNVGRFHRDVNYLKSSALSRSIQTGENGV